MITRIKSVLFDNLHIKLFALMFAVLLWMHAVTRGESEINFVVPLELKDIPAGMAVVGDAPPSVDVRIKGNESFLKGLSSRDIGAFVSLEGAKEGESAHTLTSNNIKAPYGISISRVSPVEVSIVLDAIAEKEIEVRPRITGKPARGHRLKGVEADPPKVMASGPKRYVDRLVSVQTQGVDIEGLAKSTESTVGLVPPQGVILDTGKVTVHVGITRAGG